MTIRQILVPVDFSPTARCALDQAIQAQRPTSGRHTAPHVGEGQGAGNAYGPGELYHPYRSVSALFCYAALHGLPYTVFRGYRRVFQYADDFIATLARTADRFQSGATINIGGREFREVADAHKIISEQLGLDPYRPHVSWADQDGHNTVDKRPDIERAERLLGHNPTTTLEDGIAKTLAWMRDVYGV